MSKKESELDAMHEALILADIKAEEKEKLFRNAEQEIAQLERTILLKEAEVERSEEFLGSNTTNMVFTSQRADGAEKIRKGLEQKNSSREDMIEQLENKLKEANFLAQDSERKYEEVQRKLNMLENDLMRAAGRADNSEDKIIDLEDELRADNSEDKIIDLEDEKAHQREDILKDQIRHLMARLKDAESRAEYGEMNVQRIHLQIDQLEDELIGQKQKCKAINNELQQTFNDMVQMY